jgi:hypothetical protein
MLEPWTLAELEQSCGESVGYGVQFRVWGAPGDSLEWSAPVRFRAAFCASCAVEWHALLPLPLPSALQSARLPVNLIGSPINYANRLIGASITSQSPAIAPSSRPAHIWLVSLCQAGRSFSDLSEPCAALWRPRLRACYPHARSRRRAVSLPVRTPRGVPLSPAPGSRHSPSPPPPRPPGAPAACVPAAATRACSPYTTCCGAHSSEVSGVSLRLDVLEPQALISRPPVP